VPSGIAFNRIVTTRYPGRGPSRRPLQVEFAAVNSRVKVRQGVGLYRFNRFQNLI
jgi:hypothetical protein